MAGDWIKMRHELLDSPKVVRLAKILKVNLMAARGLVWTWLAWCDRQTTDGETGLTLEEIDSLLGFRGCAKALVEIGWLSESEEGTERVVEFAKHNGESAKQRALNAVRNTKYRKRDASSVTRDVSCVSTVTQAASRNTQLDIEGEKENNKVRGSTTVDRGGQEPPAPPPKLDEEYLLWLRRACRAHPTLERSRVLPDDVAAAAYAAWQRVPELGEEDAQMLAAYMRDSLAVGSDRRKYYRPVGMRKYFEDFEAK